MSQAYIYYWHVSEHRPDELHAILMLRDEESGLYNKALLRIPFPDTAFIILEESPEAPLVNRAREACTPLGCAMRLLKVMTTSGYQETAQIPALQVKGPDLASIFKRPEVKALNGHIEEHTSVTRSRKLTAYLNMSQNCWVTLNGAQIVGGEQKLAKADIQEYLLSDWTKLEPVSLDTREAFTPPSGMCIKVLSFDIEVYKPSSRGHGMPEASERSNFVMCISSIIHERPYLDGSAERTRKFLFTIFDVQKAEEYLTPGTVIYRYSTELAMLCGFWKHVAQEDPFAILGFNTMSWDFAYIHKRMQIHGITYPTNLSIYKSPYDIVNVKQEFSNPGSYGRKNQMVYPSIPGMLILDLHKFYLRTRKEFPRHSLDYISRHYLGRGKLPMSQERMVSAYESLDPDELSLVAQYNVEDSMLVLDLFLRQQIFDEIAIEALTSETLITDLYTKTMQVRAMNKLYRYAKQGNYVMTTSPALSTSKLPGGGGDGQKLVGAYVMEPTPGRYDDVAVYDIKSMYPTILHKNNICYTTFVFQDVDTLSRSLEYKTFPWETKANAEDTAPREVHEASFVTENVKQGLCSKLIEDQLMLRERIKRWKLEGDPQGIMRYAQMSVKTVSNALIGLMAGLSERSKLAFPAAAGVVYTTERASIKGIVSDVSGWDGRPHGPVVYSDTDSVFVSGIRSPDDRRVLLDYLNTKYDPFIFELEDFGRLLIVGAKNYVMRSGMHGNSLIYKGVSFTKRNASEFVADTMKEVTAMIMEESYSRDDIMRFVNAQIAQMKSLSLDMFVMSAKISSAAKSIGGRLGRRLNANGANLMIDDEVDYVVLEKPIEDCGETDIAPSKRKPKKIGVTERTATPEELKNLECQPQIDYEYYADSLRKNVERLVVF